MLRAGLEPVIRGSSAGAVQELTRLGETSRSFLQRPSDEGDHSLSLRVIAKLNDPHELRPSDTF